MAGTASVSEHVEAARKLLKSAGTAMSCVWRSRCLLSLELGLSLNQTAKAIGCTMRTRLGKMSNLDRLLHPERQLAVMQ